MPVRWSNAYRTARNTNVSSRMARDDDSADRSNRRGLKMGYSSMVAGWRVIADMFVDSQSNNVTRHSLNPPTKTQATSL